MVTSQSVVILRIESFIRGYYAYMDVWAPEILTLIPQSINSVKSNAVTVMKGRIVGHVSFNLAPVISLFLRRDVNKAFARVTGGKVNRRAGYGL